MKNFICLLTVLFLTELISAQTFEEYAEIPFLGGRNHSKPLIYDVDKSDGDSLDLFIGESYISHYKLDPVTMTTTLITENFDSIGRGGQRAPSIYDATLTDGELDLFIGEWSGEINYYKLDPVTMTTTLISDNYGAIDVGYRSTPFIYDISSSDGNLLDLFIGEQDGNINYYKLNPTTMTTSLITENFNSIDVGMYSAPCIYDVSSTDGDSLDLFIGDVVGNIHHYKLDPATMTTTLITVNLNFIDVGSYSAPCIYDVSLTDGDSLDLFIGEYNGNVYHYKLDSLTLGSDLISNKITDISNIDVGLNSVPSIYDILSTDGDSLDLFIGEANGNINYYKLNPATMTTTLITENFNSINVGYHNAPFIYDLSFSDGDSLDLFIGEWNGNINYYKLDPATMTTTLITENFNSIDVGLYSVPSIHDILSTDGDSLDLFIGEVDGNINYYKLDPATMTTTLITENFNSIDVGGYSAPYIYDVSSTDGESLDLFIGEHAGNIHYYKLDPTTMTTTPITENFNSIGVGNYSKPIFYDADNDRDGDLICGEENGGLTIYLQAGSPNSINKENDLVINHVTLLQNYPNPFNPTTTISYQLPAISKVDISIYNLLGQKVATLVSKKQQAGTYKIEWDASGFASGLYFYKLVTDENFVQSRKLILLK